MAKSKWLFGACLQDADAIEKDQCSAWCRSTWTSARLLSLDAPFPVETTLGITPTIAPNVSLAIGAVLRG